MWHLISETYKRWRHTRGYGVHSPFAYSLVMGVVRPGRKYGHYGYEKIDNALERTSLPHSRREARTLLRLAAFLDVRSAFLPNDDRTSPFLTALRAANSRMAVTSALSAASDCQLICSTADYIPLDTLRKLLTEPGRIIALRNAPEGWRDRLFDTLDKGLMLYGRHNILLISRTGMQKVSYSISI